MNNDEIRFTPVQLTIITTDDCTAKCEHCVMCCAPGKKNMLTYSQIKHAIDSINAINKLSVVIFSGGEPTLLGEDLLESIAYCDSLGILTRIVTNAHWAKTKEKAAAYLRELREAGLGELNISTDDYHLPFIPFENIKNVWDECKNMGFSAVVIANSHGLDSKINPEYIMERLGEQIQTRYDEKGCTIPIDTTKDGTLYLLSNSCLQKVGRAKEKITEKSFSYPAEQNRLKVGCRWLLRNLAMSPDNHLWSCCGIECTGNDVLNLGDMNSESVYDILVRANDNIVLNALNILGPKFLRDFILERCPDIKFIDSYSSVCEICSDFTQNKEAITALKRYYSELIPYMVAMEERREQLNA